MALTKPLKRSQTAKEGLRREIMVETEKSKEKPSDNKQKPQMFLRRGEDEKKSKDKTKSDNPRTIKRLLKQQGMKESEVYDYMLTMKELTESQQKTIDSLRRYLKQYHKQQQEYNELRQEYQALQSRCTELEKIINDATVPANALNNPTASVVQSQDQVNSNDLILQKIKTVFQRARSQDDLDSNSSQVS
ncbi:hypothetical protein RFI_08656, partial [Reticulomyxa filosa]